MSDSDDEQFPEVRVLTASQRRVLGVLLEKAFTTPEYYPMTLKAVTTGCNQKNNRSPVVEYTEDFVEEQLHSLKDMGLVGLLLTESGRAERFRHYLRKRYSFTEPQLAILTELWLRGRQSLGDLRVRASRMVPIGDLETLRTELKGLLDGGYVQAAGSLEQRGVEVDHSFYPAAESRRMEPMPASVQTLAGPERMTSQNPDRLAPRHEIELLAQKQQELHDEISRLRSQVESLTDRLDRLARELGM